MIYVWATVGDYLVTSREGKLSAVDTLSRGDPGGKTQGSLILGGYNQASFLMPCFRMIS